MSTSDTSKKTSKKQKLAWTLVVLALGLVGYGYWFSTWPSYWLEQRRVQYIVDQNHGRNDEQLEREIKKERKGQSSREFTEADIASDRQAVLPSARRAYKIDLIAKEWEAGAKGQLMSHPARTIKGNDWHWIRTDIPVVSCMKIWASGEIWRNGGTDPKAGPDGEDYSVNPLHANQTTVIPGLRWGTFIGKVCDLDDMQGNRCGVRMPLGSTAYRSPNQFIAGQQVGAGRLWVWTNQFGTETDRSDYNIGGGAFSFDAEAAPAYMCDAVTTVANR